MSQIPDSEASAAARIPIEVAPEVFEVYIDRSSLDVRYKLLGGAELSQESRAFLSRAKLMGAMPTPYLTSDYRLAFKRTVGEAMALAIQGDLRTAEELLASADKFLADRTGEVARMWYVQATVMLLVLLFSLFPLLTFLYFRVTEADSTPGTSGTPTLKQEEEAVSASTSATAGKPTVTKESIQQSTFYVVKLYLLAILGGALGAGFSLLVRVAELRIDPASGRWSHYGEVAFRLTIGALAALIILFGMEADVFAGFLKVSSESGEIDAELYARSFWIIGVFSIAAGASERLVPSLLEQLSDRTISQSGEAIEPESPAEKA